METKAFAPGRVEWLGNHTDYNQGFVLSAALSSGINIEGKSRDDSLVVLHSDQFEGEYRVAIKDIAPIPEKHWANYVIGVVAEFLTADYDISGFDATIHGDVPIGAGLASSAALEVATAFFLKKLNNLVIDDLSLAKMAQSAEHNFAGVRCGLLDQISSIFSKEGKATFIDFRSLEVKNILVPEGYSLIIVNSGVKHALVAGEYNERRQSCENAAKKLDKSFLRDVDSKELNGKRDLLTEIEYKRAKHIVGENERVLAAIDALEKSDIGAVGRLMFESHESSKKNFENSCSELDFLVDAASDIDGCVGARLSGGGFGGATINLVESKLADSFINSIKKEYKNKYGKEPVVIVTVPSGGAR